MEWRNENSEMRDGGNIHVCMCGCFLNLPSTASAILVLYLVCPSINVCRRNPCSCVHGIFSAFNSLGETFEYFCMTYTGVNLLVCPQSDSL